MTSLRTVQDNSGLTAAVSIGFTNQIDGFASVQGVTAVSNNPSGSVLFCRDNIIYVRHNY